MKGLSFFTRTSAKGCWNLASYHSPHSMTWRWILSVAKQEAAWPRPHFVWNTYGLALGLGQMLHFRVAKDNNGIQWGCALFWWGLSYHSQRPMWFRDMYLREQDEKYRLSFRSQEPPRAPRPVSSEQHTTLQ